MSKQHNVPILPQNDSNFIYGATYSLLRYYYLLSARLRVEGLENAPMTGGAVVVCNHTRGNDYFALGISYPRSFVFMIKAEAFRWHPLIRWLLYSGGAFPVERGIGDMEALRMAVRVVQAGHPLCMFPEGHRSEDGQLQRGHTGAARIALESGAPVVPVVVLNAEAGWDNFPRFWNKPTVLTKIGKPFYLEGNSAGDRRAVSAGHRRIMTALAEMLPEDMRGAWADAVAKQSKPASATAPAAGPAATPAAGPAAVEPPPPVAEETEDQQAV